MLFKIIVGIQIHCSQNHSLMDEKKKKEFLLKGGGGVRRRRFFFLFILVSCVFILYFNAIYVNDILVSMYWNKYCFNYDWLFLQIYSKQTKKMSWFDHIVLWWLFSLRKGSSSKKGHSFSTVFVNLHIYLRSEIDSCF